MKLVLERLTLAPDFTTGQLSVDGVFQCWTLEDQARSPGVKIPGKTAIPYGTYRVIHDLSARFGRVMFHVLDVPGFAGIRIHAGTTDKDTEGCILVGNQRGPGDFIGQSRDALAALEAKVFPVLDRGEDVTLEVTVPQPGDVVA